MNKPLFAVSMRVQQALGYHEPRDALAHDWWVQIDAWGGLPLPVPNLGRDIGDWLDVLVPAVVILTGGNDVIPRDGADDDRSPERDATEHAMITWAGERGVPIFATCRGLQVVNLHFGGGVHEISDKGSHVGRDHAVTLSSPLSDLAGSDTATVNSFHNLGVAPDAVGDCLQVCAVSANDGLVEALVHRDAPIVALHWHPERRAPGARGFEDILFQRLLAEGAFWKEMNV
jgi:N5-(cytidine 5'-diphosphoramidyl)-L-glutamine hydrolase